MAPETLTRTQLNRATLARQMLLEREDASAVEAVEAVERLCGMQAQEPRPPFVGLWTRVQGFEREDLHRALHERAVVRATLMRATLHLISASDYQALRAPLAPVMTQALRVLGTRAEGLELERLLPVAREPVELPFAGHPLVGSARLLAHELGIAVACMRPPAGQVPARAGEDGASITGRPEWAPPFEWIELGSPIHQGRGSSIEVRPRADGLVEIGGRVALDEIRTYPPSNR